MTAPLLSREELLARLAIIDVEGWDRPAGTDLLRYGRRPVVRSCVRFCALRGRDAVEAEATAWEAAWESLASDYLGETEAPMNVLWAVVRRALLATVGVLWAVVRLGVAYSARRTRLDRPVPGAPGHTRRSDVCHLDLVMAGTTRRNGGAGAWPHDRANCRHRGDG